MDKIPPATEMGDGGRFLKNGHSRLRGIQSVGDAQEAEVHGGLIVNQVNAVVEEIVETRSV